MNINADLIKDVVALTKPRITLLALITTLAGIKVSSEQVSLSLIFWTLLGTALIVSGSGALNMFLERFVDGLMERTRERPLVQERISPQFGLGFGSVLVGLSLPILIYMVNPLVAWIGFASFIFYVLIYTPLKRKTSWSLIIGAIPGAAPPLMGWAAATQQINLTALMLFLTMFFWQIPHFLAIGLFRRDEYVQAGFKIFPHKQELWSIKLQMLIFTIFLFPASLSISYLGYAGHWYTWMATLLNVGFLLSLLLGYRKKETYQWGRRVFFASLLYLTLLFLALFFDGGVQ